MNVGFHIVVALRIARVYHACQPNAGTIYDETARVAILFAQRDIQPGEEISICYYSAFFSLLPGAHVFGMNPEWNIEQEFDFVKNQAIYSIGWNACPSDSSCYDPVIRALVQEGRQLHTTVIDL